MSLKGCYQGLPSSSQFFHQHLWLLLDCFGLQLHFNFGMDSIFTNLGNSLADTFSMVNARVLRKN
jgi:hypothetical protein